MGKFVYDPIGNSVMIDGRTLAHLRIVMMSQLRRSESFVFDMELEEGNGRISFWMDPSVPFQLHFFSSRPIHTPTTQIRTR